MEVTVARLRYIKKRLGSLLTIPRKAALRGFRLLPSPLLLLANLVCMFLCFNDELERVCLCVLGLSGRRERKHRGESE